MRDLAERVLRRFILAVGVSAVACGVLSLALSETVVLSGQLIVAAVVLGVATFIAVAVSGLAEAYRQHRDATRG